MAPIAKYTLNTDWFYLMRWLISLDDFLLSWWSTNTNFSWFIPMPRHTADQYKVLHTTNVERIPKPIVIIHNLIIGWSVGRSGTADFTVLYDGLQIFIVHPNALSYCWFSTRYCITQILKGFVSLLGDKKMRALHTNWLLVGHWSGTWQDLTALWLD